MGISALWRTKRARWIIAAVALAATVTAGTLIVRDARIEASRCEMRATLDAQTSAPIGTGPAVTVVGDSYAHGYGLGDARRSWVSYLGMTVTVEASSSAGYTRSGLCGSPSITELAASTTGPVIIEAGLNDLDSLDDLESAAALAIASASEGGPVVLVGPPLAPAFDAERIRAADRQLAAAAAESGARYVSTVEWDDLTYLPDNIHLTLAGHEVFGHRVADALNRGA